MKTSQWIAIFAFALAITISTPHAVKAGGHPPNAAGTATITGVVRFEGKASAPKPINMAADPSCAKQYPSPLFTQEVVADAKGELQNVIVFVAEGLGDRTFDPPKEPVVMEQKGCMYQPHVLAVRANQPVQVINDDPTSHNIHPTPVNNREWNKAEPPGTKVEEALQNLAGVTSIAYTTGDPVAMAKALTKYAKDTPEFTFKVGVVEGKVISIKEIEVLATMPSKDELLSKLLFLINAPAQRLVTAMNAVGRNLAVVVDQGVQQKKFKEA